MVLRQPASDEELQKALDTTHAKNFSECAIEIARILDTNCPLLAIGVDDDVRVVNHLTQRPSELLTNEMKELTAVLELEGSRDPKSVIKYSCNLDCYYFSHPFLHLQTMDARFRLIPPP